MENGLEAEEIPDLWNVIFPYHRSVWFDEEEGLLHYDKDGTSFTDWAMQMGYNDPCEDEGEE